MLHSSFGLTCKRSEWLLRAEGCCCDWLLHAHHTRPLTPMSKVDKMIDTCVKTQVISQVPPYNENIGVETARNKGNECGTQSANRGAGSA